VLREPAQIQFHLAFVLGLECAQLEFDCDKPSELAVVKEKIDVIPTSA
jgi:hypothetical protein